MRSSTRQQSMTGFPVASGRNGPNRTVYPRSSESSDLSRKVSMSSLSSCHEQDVRSDMDYAMGTELTVMYFACKNETFQLKKNYRRFHRFLKSHLACSLIPLHDELGDGLLPFCNLVIIAGLNAPLMQPEVGLLLEYVENGGAVLVLGESTRCPELYNAFTHHFGIDLLKDSVISIIRKKQFHPKECFVSNTIICPTLLSGLATGDRDEVNLDIVYPHGCSLEVNTSMSAPIMASGSYSYPSGRPLGAIYYNNESKGRVIVLGSGHLFSDQYIHLEDNRKLLEILLDVLVTEQELELVVRDSELREHEDYHCTGNKAGRYRGLLHDIDEYILPGSVNPIGSIKPMSLVSSKMGRADFSFLGDIFKAYEELDVERIPLSQWVKPQFEIGLPPVQLAVFPPTFRLLPPPPLELFDLDSEFSPKESRLGQLANKCTDEDGDLEFFITSMGDILEVPISPSSGNENIEDKNASKNVLYWMMTQLVNFKMSTQSEGTGSELSKIEEKYLIEDQEEEYTEAEETEEDA